MANPKPQPARVPAPAPTPCAKCDREPVAAEGEICQACADAADVPPGEEIPAPPEGQASSSPASKMASAPARAKAAAAKAGGALASLVISRPQDVRFKVAIYGPEGIGKTTFLMDAPAPIIIAAEVSSTLEKSSVDRLPAPRSYAQVIEQLDMLASEPHGFKTVGVDTIDKIQELAAIDVVLDWNKRKPSEQARSIEEVGGGFQKGYVAVYERMRRVISRLDRLYEKGMNVVIAGHDQLRKIKDPAIGGDYDQWDVALFETSTAPVASALRNFVDDLFYVAYDTKILRDHRGRPMRRAESPADGGRVCYTQRSASFRAKNRDGLPLRIPFSWAAFVQAKGMVADPQYLAEIIADKADAIGDAEIAAWVKAELEKTKDAQRLARINLKLSARLEQMQADAAAAAAAAGAEAVDPT